jgi:hypothetical protein
MREHGAYTLQVWRAAGGCEKVDNGDELVAGEQRGQGWGRGQCLDALKLSDEREIMAANGIWFVGVSQGVQEGF